ncbi:hypothetical protein JTB14_012280 [Gonioctena quinquepunctata]|nr:hypothetical protein JTB14_012280 [Gonioctena quinquepunctata]
MSFSARILLLFLGAQLVFDAVCAQQFEPTCIGCEVKPNCPEGYEYSEERCCPIGQKFILGQCRSLMMDPTAKKKET